MARFKPVKQPAPRALPKPYVWERWLGPSRYFQELRRLVLENQQLREASALKSLYAASEHHLRLEDLGGISRYCVTEDYRVNEVMDVSASVSMRLTGDQLFLLARDREVISFMGRCWVLVMSSHPIASVDPEFDLTLEGIINPQARHDS